MLFLPQSLVLSTLLLSALSSPTPQDQHQQQQQEQNQQPSRKPAGVEDFQRLLADVDDSSIHSALHLWSSKFQDGVFHRDRTALEAVHSENAPLATSLLHLAKRQSNTTISISPTSTEVVPIDNPPDSSTAQEGSQSRTDQSPPPAPSTSNGIVLPATSRTTATRAPSTQAVPISTPSSATPVATSNGRIVFSVTGSNGGTGALTTVDATSQVVSFTPSSSTILSTFTLPDGTVSTQTSITVVDAAVTGGGVGAPAASGTGGGSNPSLQQGVASATRGVWKEVIAVVGGAVVMGLAM